MTTPARRQYLCIKKEHRDAILLFRMGDFFENGYRSWPLERNTAMAIELAWHIDVTSIVIATRG